MGLRFGTAGVPRSTKGTSTEDGIKRIRELGLDHMEMEWVHQVRVNPAIAERIKAVAEENDVTLTAHGPYYINLNSQEPDKLSASVKRVLDTARQGFLCGAKSVLFHAAFNMKMDPEEVYSVVKEQMKNILATLTKEKIKIDIRPELTGKNTAWGSLDELIRLSKELKGVKPAIDFSHQHARTGGAYNSYKEFCEILEKLKAGLGVNILKDMHIHVSGIMYSDKGEKEHLNLVNSDFNYKDLIKALVDYHVEGWLVCESPNLEEDALLLKETYEKQLKQK